MYMVLLTKGFFACAILLFFFPITSYAGSIKDGASGNPGEWYIGDLPGSVTEEKRPILFIHGLNSSSETWYGNNDMYETALENGYETAFIDLYPTKDMWDNGELLAGKIADMYSHFGEKIVIVAHSKGGIDAQSALVHHGASTYVDRVITLSTPHHGSQLADLAYSSWAGWLAGIIGSKNDATYSLQTGYMSYFRSMTDSRPEIGTVPFYTFGGTEWGSFGSSLYWGGLYLNSYGRNDGAVTVKSSRLPYAQELQVGKWDHSSIKEGSSTFPLFRPYLNETAPLAAAGLETAAAAEETDPAAGQYVSGGEYTGRTRETVIVEPGADTVTFDWITSSPDVDLKLVSPDKKTYSGFQAAKDETEVLEGSYHHTLRIDDPAAGKWRLEARSPGGESYLLNTSFDSELNEKISATVNMDELKVKNKDARLKYKTDMTITHYQNGQEKETKLRVKKNSDGAYQLPKLGEGVYSLTIEVEGTYKKAPFARTMISSVYIDHNGSVYSEDF
ncbi:hypothetical protein GLW04_11670 [Halobacillus litoralis]|uniref:GPI inositol-deacylase PGAP1-like alpha/beta domain-containing protein n=2 Tax=Halobacillus litoralis TaxID=45668 RepID=A0A845DSI3_9BACI|nr:hypothetical protein [Halobacillus litoralis]